MAKKYLSGSRQTMPKTAQYFDYWNGIFDGQLKLIHAIEGDYEWGKKPAMVLIDPCVDEVERDAGVKTSMKNKFKKK